MVEQPALDFRRIAVEAAANVHVLQAIQDAQVAARIERADIAGLEPAIRPDGGGRGLRVVQIAAHDVEAAHPDFAGRAVRQRLAVGPGNAYLHAAHGPAASVGDGLEIVAAAAQGHDAGGFRQPVGGINLIEAELVLHVFDQPHRHRSRARHRAAEGA